MEDGDDCFNPTRVRLKLDELAGVLPADELQPHEGSSETVLVTCVLFVSAASTPRGFV